MNVLIVYYSKTGRTAKVAEVLQKHLLSRGAAVETLRIHRKEEAGFIQCATEARRRARPELVDAPKDLTPYDLVFVGFPIWGGSVASPVNSMLALFEGAAGRRFAPFATCGFPKGYGGGISQIRADIERLGGEVVATQGFSNRRWANLEEDARTFLLAAVAACGQSV
ncbi:MAG: flavodoxin family protein [Ignavibacteriales bacterium]